MLKYNLVNSMIGEVYPFFLNNQSPSDSYYLYRIFSPKLSKDCIPYISLEKISEKTKNEPYGHGSDILSICTGSKKNIESKGIEYLNEYILKKECPVIEKNGQEFPLIEMENGNGIQKSIIIGLRDSLRWKSYKFVSGRFVDILWTPKQFILFEIKEDKKNDSIWMEPVGVYNNIDANLTNPLNVDLSKIDYPKTCWSGKTKASELNRVIKKLEWESFGRNEF